MRTPKRSPDPAARHASPDEHAERTADMPADHPSLRELDNLRRSLWFTGLAALIVASALVVVMSYFTDVFPAGWRKAVDFAGWRFTFLSLSTLFVVYAVARERVLRRVTRRYVEEAVRAHRLGEAERVRSEVVATISHELKTPLTSIMGYALLLRKRAASLTPEQRAEYVGVMEKQGQRIMQLIEELLQSSRMESDDARLQRVPLDIAGIVTRIAKEMGPARGRRIEVSAPASGIDVYGDPSAMEHVVTNLLDNACKYASEGTPVEVAVRAQESAVLVTVSDHGPGIPHDELSQIFERFHQASNARGTGSVGLGLHIVRTLVQAQGGRVWADSDGGGTTFTVALPRRRDAIRDGVETDGRVPLDENGPAPLEPEVRGGRFRATG